MPSAGIGRVTMTNTIVSESERNRLRTVAAGGFGLAAIGAIVGFLAFGQSGYESAAFVWLHLVAVAAAAVAAIAVTALLYAEGIRGLGLSGVVGAAFAWLSVGVGFVWFPLAWESTVLVQSGSPAIGEFTALFGPMGTGYASAFTIAFSVGMAGVSLGLWGTGYVHRVAAGLGVVVGGGTALVHTYAQAAVMNLDPLLPLVLLTFLALLPVGLSLYRRRDLAAGETDVESTASA